MTPAALSLWAGFAIGLVFGAVGQRTGFCLTRAMHGLWITGDSNKLRAFALALAVAILCSQALDAAGLIDLRRSIYLASGFSWLLVPLGGIVFGYGMIMANGCGARALVLLGQGNLRAFVVLLCLGIAAYASLTGIIAPLRTWLAALTSTDFSPVPPTLPAVALGQPPAAGLRLSLAAALSAALAAYALASPTFRASARDLAGGLIIGALVPAGWLATGVLGADDFEPVPLASLTFIAPIGETIQYLMLATGTPLRFGVTAVAGTFLGALIAALASGSARLESFSSPQRMLRSMAGGVLMGVGGALALGCSIGQGLSGLSTLAIGSLLAAAGIFTGASLALRGPLRLPQI
jgi:uncharacterized membrane protein YedE/YeeE